MRHNMITVPKIQIANKRGKNDEENNNMRNNINPNHFNWMW